MSDFDWIEDIRPHHIDYPETWKGKKMNRKDFRRFKHLAYKYAQYIWGMRSEKELKEIIDIQNQSGITVSRGLIEAQLELYKLGKKYGMTEEDVRVLVNQQKRKRQKQIEEYRKKPKRERKDNKKSINWGSGSGGSNRIRYPSKKRSRQTWRNFYNLFPHLAERDGWDGKKSKRMK